MSHPEALPARGVIGAIEAAERRASATRVALGFLAVCAVAIVVAPSAYLSFDEAKYLAIGRNVLLGHGPVTDFGSRFLAHSPLFAVVLAAPQQAFGIDALAWGHVLDALGFLGVVALTMLLARSRGPWVAVLAGAGIGAWIMLFSLSRTARLDVPQAAIVLAYAWIALRAASSGRVVSSLAAGLVLAAGFLVKESAIVLGPIPFLVAIATQRTEEARRSGTGTVTTGERLRRAVFSGGIVLLVFLAGTSWWFGWVGTLTGRLYLIGLPARDGPILGAIVVAVGLAALVVAGPARRVIGWEKVGRWLDGSTPGGSTAGGSTADGSTPGGSTADVNVSARVLWLAAALGVAWAVVLIVALARSGVLHGTTLISLTALGSYVGAWGVSTAPVIVFGLGAIPAVIRHGQDHRAAAGQPPVRLLAFGGLVASVGWVLLVVATGEPPRNLIAQAALLAILAADGWAAAIEGLDRRLSRARASSPGGLGKDQRVIVAGATVVGGALVGAWAASILEQTGARASLVLTLVVVIAGGLVGFAAWMFVAGRAVDVGGRVDVARVAEEHRSSRTDHSWHAHLVPMAAMGSAVVAAVTIAAGTAAAFQPNSENQARAAATAAIAGWLDANVAPGGSVAFGSLQAHETAVTLDGRYRLTMLAPEVGTIDPRASLGLRSASRLSVPDWIAMDAHPRLQALYAFRASRVTSVVEHARPEVVVYVSGLPTSAPSLVGALLASAGVTQVEHWSWPIRGGAIVVDILRIDPSTFRLPTDRVFAEAAAVSRLADRLRTSVAGSTAATELAARLTFWPTSADDARALGELGVAARGSK